MRRPGITAVAWVLVAGVGWSCGRGGEAAAASAGGRLALAAYCQGLVQEEIGFFGRCMRMNPDLLSGDPAPVAYCGEVQKEVAAGLVAYDAAQAQACLVALQALDCGALGAGGYPLTLPPACPKALVGTRPTNGACYQGQECAAGTCTAAGATCPGTCQPFAQLDQGCASVPCGAGLTCDHAAQVPTCQVPSGLNGSCPCQPALWCDPADGRCKAPQKGGTCSPVASGQCANGYSCVAGSCQLLSVAGGACSLATGPECGIGYVCVRSTCAPFPRAGQGCGPASPNCIGGYCDLAAMPPVCVAYKTPGAACAFDWECASQACDPGSHVCVAARVCAPP